VGGGGGPAPTSLLPDLTIVQNVSGFVKSVNLTCRVRHHVPHGYTTTIITKDFPSYQSKQHSFQQQQQQQQQHTSIN
jgi:hypothetical protein